MPSAWADGPQCETDPAACIQNPCDPGSENYDPDQCEGPDPDPDPDTSCINAQSGTNTEVGKALARLKTAAADAKRQERHRANVLLNKAIASNALNAEQVRRLKEALSYSNKAATSTIVDGQKNTAQSCPKPDKQSCFDGALATYEISHRSCITTLVFQGMLSGLLGYPPLSTVFDDYERCKNSAEAAFEFRLQWCNSLD